MKVIGITGGVGAGKSTVLHMLKELCRCEIIMADDVAKELMNYGQSLCDMAIRLFGTKAYDENKELDMAYIASKIYADESLRMQWTDVVHPAVNKHILDKISKAGISGKYDFVFIEAALLIENGYDNICDELWYVYASEDVRRDRLKKSRGYSDARITGIFDSQMKEEEFRKYCDFIIDTGISMENTYNTVKNKLEEYHIV